jgi:GNAT superfamily N-acetyltransferase
MATIQKARVKEADEILNLQKLAYQSEARLYNDWNLPALTQSIESLVEEMSDSITLVALVDGVIIGSVRAKTSGGCCQIGRLIVHPEHQGKGVGSRLLREIEHRCRHAKNYELFTGSLSAANIRLYERHGYTVTRTVPLSKTVSITYMEKCVS